MIKDLKQEKKNILKEIKELEKFVKKSIVPLEKHRLNVKIKYLKIRLKEIENSLLVAKMNQKIR